MLVSETATKIQCFIDIWKGNWDSKSNCKQENGEVF